MKIAIIGSRNLTVTDLGRYLPTQITEIISGGVRGIDRCVHDYAHANKIPLTEILPDYRRYGKGAPLKRNLQIIGCADAVIAFWDGKSHGTRYVVEQCRKQNIPVTVHLLANEK